MQLPAPSQRTFGQYDVESTLGRGAMGMVYLARDRRIGRKVALKTVQVDQILDDESETDEFYKRLQREAELSGSLQHPNIVTLYEAGYDNDRIAFLATEYIDGESLKDRLKKTKPLPLPLALSIAEDILTGLAFAHAHGIVHRDIKPANILLTKDSQAKIADFGIARPLDSSLTTAGALLGTPNYMSPEQVKSSSVTPRSDLFAVGIVMYEMLTGTKPFAAEDLSGILQRILHHEPPLATAINGSVPDDVSALVKKLLAKSPDDRFPAASAALEDLRKIRRGIGPVDATVAVGTDSATMRPSEWSAPTLGESSTRRFFLLRRVPAAAAWGVLLAIAASVLTMLLLAERESRRPPQSILTPSDLELFAAKRAALAEAQRFIDEKKYDDAIRILDDYLADHPYSAVAQERRAAAMQLREATQPKKPRSSVTVDSRKPRRKEPEPEKPPSRWDRVKRWFRGK